MIDWNVAGNDEETVDMDELQKEQDTDIDEEADVEPDSELEDDSDIEEVPGEEPEDSD